MTVVSFLRNWIACPARVGAVAPSSSRLAEAMCADVARADCILEVGAGTGAITRALVGRVADSRIIAVEPHEEWAQGLQARFPSITVRACALERVDPSLLRALPENTRIVSGLPFRSLPRATAEQARGILIWLLRESPQRRLVQFSYWPAPPFDAPDDMVWKLRKFVMVNVPPAGVWELGLRRQGWHQGPGRSVDSH